MLKYVIYNPEDDTYLWCGNNVHEVIENDVYVDDVNEATLFNTLNEVWSYLKAYQYTIEPVVLKVNIDVTPDHTVDYFKAKQKEEGDKPTLDDALVEELMKRVKSYEDEKKNEVFDMFADILDDDDFEGIEVYDDKLKARRTESLVKKSNRNIAKVNKKPKFNIKKKKSLDERDIYNPLDSEYI